MCSESSWSQPQSVAGRVSLLPNLREYLSGTSEELYGRQSCCNQHPFMGEVCNLSSETGTCLHVIKESLLLLRTVCMVRWDSWMEKCLIQRKGFPVVNIFIIWGKGSGVAHPSILHPGSSTTLWMEDQLPWQPNLQQLLSRAGKASWHQEVGGSGGGGGEVRWAQILATPTGPLRRGKWGQLQSAPGSWEQAAGLGTLCAKGGLRRQAAADYRTFHQSSCNRSALDSVPLRRSTL